MSLQWRLPILMGALLVVVIGALCASSYVAVRRNTEEVAAARLREVNGQLVDLLELQAQSIGTRVSTAAARPAVAALLRAQGRSEREAFQAAFAPATSSDSQIVAIQLLSPNGAQIYSTGRLAALVADRPTPEELPGRLGNTDTTAVGRMTAHGDTVLYPAVAVVNDQGERLGYLVLWRRSSSNPRTSSFISNLIGSEARFYIGTPGGTWMDESGVAPAPEFPAADTGNPDHLFRYQRAGNGVVLAVAAAITGTPWYVVLEFPAETVHAPADRFLAGVTLIGGVLLLLGLAGTWAVSRHLVAPLVQLTSATQAFGHGKRGTRVGVAGEGEIRRLAEAFNRMAEQVDTEAGARESSEAQWRLLFDQNPRPMWVTDRDDGRFLAVNEAAVELYGYTRQEFFARTVADLRAPEVVGEDLAGVTPFQRHQTKERGIVEVEITTHDVLFSGRPAELALTQNITARKLRDAQSRQAQKMEAVGRLAGGVAHDFNNLLAVITPYAEMMREETPDGTRNAEDLDHIIAAAERGRALTRQLLTFSRQNVVQASTLSPSEAVKGVEGLLRRLLGEDVELVIRLDAGPSHIRIDPGQFEQILINLAVNSRDAMPHGGHLVITTSEWSVDQQSLSLHGLKGEGRYVVVTVTDTGVGMDAETCGRVFEPFFTTKAPGKGTGIGLATVYGIVTQNGGQITVYSEPGAGTTFRLYFPVTAKEGTATPAASRSLESLQGKETILLVEDDAAVRSAAVGVLERSGYTVLVATDPEDAQMLAARHRRSIDLVISDVVMPRVSGPTLLASLRKHRPDLKVLLISGYAGEALSARGEIADDIPFLEKPFTVTGLLAKVRDVLDGKQTGRGVVA